MHLRPLVPRRRAEPPSAPPAPSAPSAPPRATAAGATGPPARTVAGIGVGVAGVALASFVVVAVAVLRSGGRDRWDVAVRHEVLRHAGRAGAALAAGAGELTAPALLVVVTLLAALALWRWAHRPLLGVGVVAVAVSTAALVQLLALAFSDVRPTTRTVLGLPVFDGSFPSVRTAEGEALWGALVLAAVLLGHRLAVRLVWAGVGVVVSAAVVWGQLDRARSWPTDVLGGWLLGAGAVGLAAALLVTWPTLPAVPAAPLEADPGEADGPGTARSGVRGSTLSR